ncbi:MAG: HD domain-containing protein [Deltaproteobacteria bacterium]|nr:HD domain-containing protein [Deltaproteobacteria bacterium]
MSYPDYNSCLKSLTDEGVNTKVINHVKAVHQFAVIIGNKFVEQGHMVNMPLIEAGALLHDIGRSNTHGLAHALAGCEIAERLGLPDDLISIIRNHIGAGITKEEAVNNGLPSEDYIPLTLEEKIVAAADNLAAGDILQTIAQHEESLLKKGITEGAKRCVALHKELSEMCGIDLDILLAGNKKSPGKTKSC